jgi:uncharacterized protein (TIGR03083 family)
MPTFDARIEVLAAESARLERYFRALPPEAWARPSACTQWQVQDVVAHLVGVAEFYAGTVTRGLGGETAPPAGRSPAGTGTGASAAEGIAQRSIAARKSLGDRLLDTFAATGQHLNQVLKALTPAQRPIPCYHPGGMVPAENFIELRLKELGVHEWDIRAALEPPGHHLGIDRLRVPALGLLVRPHPGGAGALPVRHQRPRAEQARSGHRWRHHPDGSGGDGVPRGDLRM